MVVICNSLGMPGNILRALPEKIIFAPRRPEPFQLILEKAPVFQRISGTALGFPNDLLPVQRIVQTAAQGSTGLGVQLTHQR